MPRRVAFALILAFALPRLGSAWGDAGHHIVVRQAIQSLPEPLRTFFLAHAAFLEDHSLDPDRWREAKKAGEGQNHFFDLDAFPGEIDRDEATHLARRGTGSGAKGRVPWRIVEVYHEFVADMRSGDKDRILEDAAVLSHYVADSHVPFHATENYDGQLTHQKGIHARWESVLVAHHEEELETSLHVAPAEQVQDPLGQAFSVLRSSLALSRSALASDEASLSNGTDPYGPEYEKAFYEREREALRSRLAGAAHMTGSLWLSAWNEAGRPPL